MNTRLSTVSLVTIALLLAAYPMLAHHSNAVFDHEHLTYRYAGRDFRLTDVYGRVIHELIA